MAQAGLARNKCGSGLASRCAARAALDLTGADCVVADTWWPFYGVSCLYFSFLKLKVDALLNPLIMRPTSSDIGTTNSLRFNELSS
ncbi:hypothetical protein C1X73_26660, partial [Pseudomonas sp. FW305-130]